MVTTDVQVAVLRLKPAAQFLAMNEKDLRRLLHAGEIEHYQTPGGHFRIPVTAPENYTRRKMAETSRSRA